MFSVGENSVGGVLGRGRKVYSTSKLFRGDHKLFISATNVRHDKFRPCDQTIIVFSGKYTDLEEPGALRRQTRP